MIANSVRIYCIVVLNLKLGIKIRFKTFCWLLEVLYKVCGVKKVKLLKVGSCSVVVAERRCFFRLLKFCQITSFFITSNFIIVTITLQLSFPWIYRTTWIWPKQVILQKAVKTVKTTQYQMIRSWKLHQYRYFLTWIWISYYHEITTPISGLLALLAVSTNIIGS